MNNSILFVHVLKIVSQIYFLNIMRNAEKCQCNTFINEAVLFNGHLISLILPLFIRMRKEFETISYAFDLLLIGVSALYTYRLWQTECHTKCKNIHKPALQTYVIFYLINVLLAILMIAGSTVLFIRGQGA